MVLLALLLAATAADFNGRWNITVEKESRGRVWWLEVTGAGTPSIEGKFVGAPGGQMDHIPSISVQNGELVWSFDRAYLGGTEKHKGVYRARVEGGKLTGSFEVQGHPPSHLNFHGVHAPELKENSRGKWNLGKPIELFNGRDLTGWECRVAGKKMEWYVENGALKNRQGAADITSTQRFWNFTLHAEYRVSPKSNSGIGLRGRYEVQIYEDFGEPPSLHGNGALYSRIIPTTNASKKAGEWQTFDITLIGREVTVVLNGKTVIDRKPIEGFTAMATDINEDQPGPITLQGDHGPVEFRKVTITPLTH